jgi:hypothetical protein
MYTRHGQWFEPPGATEPIVPEPGSTNTCLGALGCTECAQDVAVAPGADPSTLLHAQKMATDPVYRHHAETMAHNHLMARLNQGPPSSAFSTAARAQLAYAAIQPKPDKPQLDIDAVADWYHQYHQLKATIKTLTEQADEARAHILDYLKTRWGGELPQDVEMTVAGRPALRRQMVSQSRVDVRRLRSELPDVAEHFTTTSEYEKVTIL